MNIAIVALEKRQNFTVARIIVIAGDQVRIQIDLRLDVPDDTDPYEYAYDVSLSYLDPA